MSPTTSPLSTNSVDILRFVSQRLPSKLHKITALALVILAIAVAARYAFRAINASRFEPFSNKCTRPQDVTDYLKQRYSDNKEFLDTLPALEKYIEKIYNAPQNQADNKKPDEVVISEEELNSENIPPYCFDIIIKAFSYLNPLLIYDNEYVVNRLEGPGYVITVFLVEPENIEKRNKLKEIFEPKIELAIRNLEKNTDILGVEVPLDSNKNTNNLQFLLEHLEFKHPDYRIRVSRGIIWVSKEED